MKSFPLIDLHQDLLAHLHDLRLFPNGKQTDFEMLKSARTKVAVVTAFPLPPKDNYFDPITNDLIEADFHGYARHAAKDPSWRIIQSRSDLTYVLQTKNTHGLLMHIEGLNVVNDHSWNRLERWYNLGWRSIGIVWNLTNPLGGGTLDGATGLTPLGKKLITWAQERRMVIDFAHMNRPTFWDALDIVQGPVVISHGNACRVCVSPRNYDDEQLRAVAERDGVAGIFFANTYVVGKERRGTVEDVANHIDHFVSVMGIDHVALGTDFGGIITGLIEGLESLDRLPALWAVLAKRGYSDSALEQIAWKNAARTLQQIL